MPDTVGSVSMPSGSKAMNTDEAYASMLLVCGMPVSWALDRDTAQCVEEQTEQDAQVGMMMRALQPNNPEITRTGYYQWCRRAQYGGLHP